MLFILFLTASFLSIETVKEPKLDTAEVFFLDVGQGDAELIQKGNFQILVDGGPDDKILTRLGEVMPALDREIEIIILTHPDADHSRGLNSVLSRYQVNKIYSTGVLGTTNVYTEFLSLIRDKKISFAVPQIGEVIVPFENSELSFLWPGDKYISTRAEELNNTSEIAKFCYFNHCVLLPGDIETEAQQEMLEHYKQKNQTDIFQSEIYKMPHHGSSNGVNEELIKIVAPKFAVINVGVDNNYGHPHQLTLDVLNNLKIETLRTDKNGTIKFELTKEGVARD